MSDQTQRRYVVIGAVLAALGALLVLLWAPWQSAVKPAVLLTAIDAGTHQSLGPRPTIKAKAGTGPHTLKGWVRGADNQSIVGAQVTSTLELGPGVAGIAPAGATAIVAVSAVDGVFELKGLEAGRHRLRIEGPGLVSAELRFVEAPRDGLVVVVSRQVSVVGSVVGAKGDPSDVRVFLSSEASTQRREVAPEIDGTFAFRNAAEGRFQLWAQGPGQASPSQVALRLGAGPFEDVSVVMQPAFALRGRVVEAGASTLGLVAQVRVQSQSGEPARMGISAEDGSFSVAGLLPGLWTATASAPGYEASKGQSISADDGASVLLTLGAGGRVVGVVRSAAGAVLEGAYVELVGVGADGAERRYGGAVERATGTLGAGQRFVERGELGVLLGPIPLVPPAGAYAVRVADVLSEAGAEPTVPVVLGRASNFHTDALGRFSIFGAAAGRYRLYVRHPDYANTATKRFVLRSKGKAVERIIVLHSGTQLTGAVLTKDGVAIVGASVFAKFSDDREQALAVTAADGSFAFSPMTGAVELVVEAVGFGRFRKKMTLGQGGLVATAKHLEARLRKADAVLEGRLVDSAGFPIRGAEVAIADRADALPSRPVTSDGDGLFRIEGLVPGLQTLEVRHPEFPPHAQKITATLDVEVSIPLGAALEVRVRDTDSDASLALVHVTLSLGTAKHRGISNEVGVVRFTALTPGKATIEGSLEGFAAEAQSVSLKAQSRRGVPPQSATLSMARGSILAGIVYDVHGDRLVGAVIRVGENRAITDREGRFRLEEVNRGAVVLIVEKGGVAFTEAMRLDSGEERVTLEIHSSVGRANEDTDTPELDDEVNSDEESPDDEARDENLDEDELDDEASADESRE